MFKLRSIAAKISIYIAVLVLVICGILGVLAYRNGTEAVKAEVRRRCGSWQKRKPLPESRFELQLAVLETVAERRKSAA